MTAKLACAAAAAILLLTPGLASAAVTVSLTGDGKGQITVTGTARADSTVASDDGTSVRFTNATAGTGCTQAAGDALCPREARTITGDLGAQADSLTNQSSAPASLTGGDGNDRILGGSLRDSLNGGAGDDDVDGGAGDDTIIGGAGADRLTGGTGIDTVDYSASPVAIHAHLNTVGGLRVREFSSTPTDDTLTDQFENLLGSAIADVLRGSDSVANTIRGNGGSDVIDGRTGDDTLHGDSGADRFGVVAGTVQETATAAQVTVGNAGAGDGRDTFSGGSGNDDINARDSFLDAQIDCGTGTDIARQDLVDDDGNLDVNNCETLETTAIDQLMTIVRKVVQRRGRTRITLACPRKSRVVCKGTAGLARRARGPVRRTRTYSIRQGRSQRLRLRGVRRYLKLVEHDQLQRDRLLVRRI